MGTQLDFDSTKRFRDVILAKTLSVPNGPQTFNSTNYTVNNLRTLPDIDSGEVDDNRPQDLLTPQTTNIFKPINYLVKDTILTQPRRANLQLYPYFLGGQEYSLISIMNTSNYDTESELMKFAASYIKEPQNGPVSARIQQNLYRTTVGKLRVIDALEGNTATLVNLFTGREPLIEGTSNITVANTLVGKGVDFLQTVSGVEFPWSEIPGNYLSNPRRPSDYKPTANSGQGNLLTDITGALGSILGIQRRPTLNQKPSDLFISYLGERQKSILFNNISYSRYAPDYTTTARSQNSSKLFNFVDKFAQGVKSILGTEAPLGGSYIGDDRGEDVKYAMSDFNERPIRSPYYLSLMFDPIQTKLLQRTQSLVEGNRPGSNLTWISSKSKNEINASNINLSREITFRQGSILGITQDILETLPSDAGASRSHVANVIDQTSRVFREGDQMLSRGNAVKYVDKFTKEETGVEYCRVWTKDSPYLHFSNTMKGNDKKNGSGLIRKYESSVLSSPWNLNIYPNSNGRKGDDAYLSSTNIQRKPGGGFHAKKYMFSIENLAWKTSNLPGFTYNDLPYCERGPNDGRVMWFPPYDLKVTEQNNAKWESNSFLGRPEPVYTYQNTERSGQVSFKLVVDHPSILNLLVSDLFKNMSDEESDNYINAFFAGCVDIDFYGLIRRFPTLSQSDVQTAKAFISGTNDEKVFKDVKNSMDTVKSTNPVNTNTNKTVKNILKTNLYFNDNYPSSKGSGTPNDLYTTEEYGLSYANYLVGASQYSSDLGKGLDFLLYPSSGQIWGPIRKHDYKSIFGHDLDTWPVDPAALKSKLFLDVDAAFKEMQSNYTTYKSTLTVLKDSLSKNTVDNITLNLFSSTSSTDTSNYNLKLSYRRSHSIILDIIKELSTSNASSDLITWKNSISSTDVQSVESDITFSFADLGYKSDGTFIINYVKNAGEQSPGSHNVDCSQANQIQLNSPELKRTVPTNFYCRQSEVTLEYATKDSTEPVSNDPIAMMYNASNSTTLPKVTAPLSDERATTKRNKPPIDELKKIVMKALSEGYYFKKLEDINPLQFTSLKEKLKYFHPAFHSMTPEGLNGRLTFLQQCVRPGDTLPIKGISDENDLNARNTTFGPPPICIMRIGDFYHSKIIIRDLNITFEEGIWDLNPEGIGVQPMIANVVLQVNFIGGHGMEKPVERLQNALSSNFYANTEVYDERSTSTQDAAGLKLNKEQYQRVISNPPYEELLPVSQTTDTNKVIEGNYIGNLINNGLTLSYSELLNESFSNVTTYFKSFQSAYNSSITKYGLTLTSMFLSPTYRLVNEYDVSAGGTVNLLGEYKPGQEFEGLSTKFKDDIITLINSSTVNLTTLFGFNSFMSTNELLSSESILKPYVTGAIIDIVDGFNSYKSKGISPVESERNKLILTLDKLNYLVDYEQDGVIDKGIGKTIVNNPPIVGSDIYNKYSKVVNFITTNSPRFTEDLITVTYNFKTSTMTVNDMDGFLKTLLRFKMSGMVEIYKNKPTVFTQNTINLISSALELYISNPESEKKFDFKYPISNNDLEVIYDVTGDPIVITDTLQIGTLIKVHTNSKTEITDKLNYYR
jgi:hypothetical protein